MFYGLHGLYYVKKETIKIMFVLQLSKGVLLRDMGLSPISNDWIIVKTSDLDSAIMCRSKKDFQTLIDVLVHSDHFTPEIITCSQFINSVGRGDD